VNFTQEFEKMNVMSNIADYAFGKRTTASPMQPDLDSNKSMHALVWQNSKDVQYVTTPKPILTDATDVIVKVTATTICGSDLHMYSGNMLSMKSGDILGHEFMGVIEEIGPEVKNFQVGQRVVCAFDIACGKCDFCTREEFTACKVTNPSILEESMFGHRTCAIFGYSHLTGGVPGGQADYVRVPFADTNCLSVPDELPDEKALYLSDIVPTALFGVEMGKVKKGDTVGIWGLGPIGLLVAKWCQIKGASRIIGIDCVPERFQIAHANLIIETLDFNQVDVVKELATMFPDGLDVGIECAGFEYAKTWKHKIERAVGLESDQGDILTEIIQSVRGFGHVAILGVYTGTVNHFPIGSLMEKGLTMSGGQSPTQKYWKYSLEMMLKGDFDPTFLITHRGTLDDGPTLYKKFYNREEGMLKCFIRPNQYVESTVAT
jgi:threonine dehydrogenase-like Zn-dependent dehydrogenase